MFEHLLQSLALGKDITCKGEKFIAVHTIPRANKSLYLAIKDDAKFPAPVFLVEQDVPDDKEKTP